MARPNLTWRIPTRLDVLRDILSQYPDDGQILKEILQNAEDAGAKRVIFLYDKHEYSKEGLDPKLAKFQGPALYAYNDAVFSDDDFCNLLNIQHSSKREDRTKVGRFGRGFKSVFHMTEMPTLLSGAYFGRVNPYNDGEICMTHAEVLEKSPAEFDSFYGKFGFSEEAAKRGFYNGTVFRFPLRQEKSLLCETLYGKDEIQELFRMLETDGYMNLLFLKSLESIAVSVREAHADTPEGVCRFSIQMKKLSIGSNVRQKFFKDIGMQKDEVLEEERKLTYQVEFKTSGVHAHADHKFVVCHYYNGKKESRTMQKLLEDPNFSYLPLVSVAIPIGLPHPTGDLVDDQQPTIGQLFCFLPLPLHDNRSPTGLPIHINSFFVVSSNRSEIKWPTTGQRIEKMTKDLQWNQCLITELLPKAYAHLLQDATSYPDVQPNDICRAFPDLDRVDDKWKDTLIPPFLRQVHSLPIFPSSMDHVTTYVYLKDAILCPPNLNSETRYTLVKLLFDAKLKPVCIPSFMASAVKGYSPSEHVIEATPLRLCNLLKICNRYHSYLRDEKLHLLKYLLSEADDIADELNGIHLLPLADESFTAFFKDGPTIYIPTDKERALLPVLKHRFLSDNLDQSLKEMLKDECITDNTQLVIINDEDILELLPQIFPRVNMKEKILKLKPNHEPALGHLTFDWCEKLWHFFSQISEDIPDHLTQVKHLHILPIVNTHTDFNLSRLSGGAVCVAAKLHNTSLSAPVSKVLTHLGIHVLQAIPDAILHHPFLFDEGYVHEPNPHSILQALLKLHNEGKRVWESFNLKSTADEKKAFLKFLEPLGLGSLDQNSMSLLQQFQLFETVEGSGNKQRHHVSLADVPLGVVSYRIPVKPRCKLIDVSSPPTLIMAKLIGINIMSETKIIEEFLLDDIDQRAMSPGDLQKVMIYVLKDIKSHFKESDKIRGKLQNLSFLEDEEGHYRLASELFDPADSLLMQLFSGENKFPSEHYHGCLEALRLIGLKSRSHASIDDLNHSAVLVHRDVQNLSTIHTIATNQHECDKVTKLKMKSKAIAKLFLENLSLKDHQKSRRLHELEWIPVQLTKPRSYPNALTWNPDNKLFHRPSQIAMTTYTTIIASSVPIVDIQFVQDEALHALLGVSPPPYTKVIEHLSNISRSYSSKDKAAIIEMTQAVYTFLMKHDTYEIEQALLSHKLREWIWHGDGFTSTECVSISLQFNENLTPYAYTLPKELVAYGDWLSGMGVEQRCNPVNILKRMKDWHDSDINISTERINHDRLLAVNLLNKIVESHPNGVPDSIQQAIVLPVETSDGCLCLLLTSQCTYHDKDWVLGEAIDVEHVSQEDDETLHFLHRSISKATATFLGIATMMNRLLDGDCEGFEYATEIQGHGQAETLTHRLKQLLVDYPDGLAIPKELIQNADDARATTIKFLFDERENEHCMTGLLDNGMKLCQGPALWIYNNAEFTDNDLANIRKLGGATKEAETDKIGKFGLGFNAVYNVTDVPSFVSREHVVFFDPHRTHLGKAMPRNDTGLKINLCTGSKRMGEIRKQLCNQFKPYDGVFNCKMNKAGDQSPYPGTLFRLPLRKPGTVSEIKNSPYSREDVVELMQLLLERVDELLLFTQHVEQIDVYHLPSTKSDPRQATKLYTAERNTKSLKRLSSKTLSHNNLLQISKSEVQELHQEFTDGLHTAEKLMTSLEYVKGSSTTSLGLSGHSRVSHWLRYGCFGLAKSLALALKNESDLPVAGIAVKLCPDEDKFRPIVQESAPVYCHLPLPSSVKSGLPVIVNGCFAVKPDRRHLVQLTSDDKQSAMNIWNTHLQEDAVTEAYIGALELVTKGPFAVNEPYCLWPSGIRVNEQFQTVCKSFYSCLETKTGRLSPKVFTNQKTWVDFEHAVFLDELLVCSNLKQVASKRLQAHLDTQPGRFVVIDLPLEVRREFSDLTTKTYGIHGFYRDAFLPYLHRLEQEERDALLLFGLKATTKNVALKELFEENPCIPLQPKSNSFAKPCNLISPNGRCKSLFDAEDGVFPIDNLCKEPFLGILESMGMKSDHIAWQYVIERAKSVQRLPKDRSIERTKHLLAYIAWKHEQRGTETTKDLEKLKPLRCVKFLPVKQRIQDYPQQLRWCGDSYSQDLAAADDLYLPKHSHLSGSSCLFLDEIQSGLRDARTSRLFLEQALGLDEKKPDVCQVIDHLHEVSSANEVYTWIKDSVDHVYRYLNLCCLNDAKTAKTKVSKELGESRCILVGDHFMYPNHIAQDFEKDIAPFMSKVPYQLSRSEHLLAALQVKASFEPVDFIEALHRVKSVSAKITTVRDIAEGLQKLLTEQKITIEDVLSNGETPILLPSSSDEGPLFYELLPVDSLCLNLYPWLKKPVLDHNLKYVHSAITPQVAKDLGVKTDGENIFETLGCGFGEFGESFGQRESLTTRIRNILEGYPCDEGILKELLQNADDAGASELRFILDTETLGGERVFHKKWQEMQGPALYVFNNCPFTRDDLKGISNLGQGSKCKDTTKTGQYGIGFNSVYHLTDVPSFLTDMEDDGNTLCFFDPNCSHVPGANALAPGRLFQGKNLQEMQTIFPDMYKGYLQDRFQNLNLKGSTLFRLPLRSTPSEISKKLVTADDVQSLLNTFKNEVFHSLLFITSVRTVSLEKNGDSEQYKVTSSLSDEDQAKLSSFTSTVKLISSKLKNGSIQLENIGYKEVVYTLNISDSDGRDETWSICQCIGFKSKDSISAVVKKAVSTGDIALLPRGGAAYCRDNRSKHRLYCFLPLPIDNPLPIHVNGHFAIDQGRRSLLDDIEDRPGGYKQAWNKMLMEEVVPYSYISLLTKECNLLSSKRQVSSAELETFYRVFPELNISSTCSNKYIQALCKAFYTILKTSDLRCLVVQIPTPQIVEPRWFSVQQCLRSEAFFDSQASKSLYMCHIDLHSPASSAGPQPSTLGEILRRLGFNLLAQEVPLYILQSLLAVNAKVNEVAPSSVLNFLYNHKHQSCKLKNLPMTLHETPFKRRDDLVKVIRYCYSCGKHVESRSLQGLPLCLTKDDNLQQFQSEKDIFGPMFSSLIQHQDMFLDASVYHSLPTSLLQTNPCCVQQFTIAKLVPFLKTGFSELLDEYRYKWDPFDLKTGKWQQQWIQTLWQLIRQDCQTDCRKLEPLSDLCILPVKVNDGRNYEYYLYPLKDAGCVVDIIPNEEMYNLQHNVQKLVQFAGVPVLDVSRCTVPERSTISDMPQNLVSNIRNARGILKALSSLSLKDHSSVQLKRITSSQSNAWWLVKYLSQSLNDKCTAKDAEQFLSLPIHQVASGKIMSLQNHYVYLIPQGVPKAGLDNCYRTDVRRPEQFISTEDSEIQKMYQRVGSIEKTTVDLYVELILVKVNFIDFFSDEERLQHLVYIKDTVLPNNKQDKVKEVLLAALYNLPFLKGESVEFRCAKDFFNPLEPLFKEMETTFPEKKFQTNGWINFLGECGLQKTVRGEDLVRYAKQVEEEGKLQRTDIKRKATLICQKLPGLVFNDKRVLFQLKDIKFLPMGKVDTPNSELHHQHNPDKLQCISFQESVFYTDYKYCWTVAKVLPKWLESETPYSRFQYGLRFLSRHQIVLDQATASALDIQAPPPPSLVVSHCIELSRSLSNRCDRTRSTEMTELAMETIYSYLTKHVNELMQTDLDKLAKIPMICVDGGENLVCPNQVVAILPTKNAIEPYLYALPESLQEHRDVFSKIGVKKDVECNHYINVLSLIKDECTHGVEKVAELDPKQLSAAEKATVSLFDLIDEDKSKKQQIASDSKLYLLSEKQTLELSTNLVQVDGRRLAIKNRMQRVPWPLSFLRETRSLEKAYKSLPELPQALQPKMLSKLVEEDIDESCLERIEPFNGEEMHHEHIESIEFRDGLNRLLRQEVGANVRNFGEEWNKLQENMTNITFLKVNGLRTVLKMVDGGVLENSAVESKIGIFIKTIPGGRGTKVYIEDGKEDITKENMFVDKFFAIIMDTFACIEPMFEIRFQKLFRWSIYEISMRLDEEGVQPLSWYDEMLTPNPGEVIPRTLHGILKEDIGTFKKGDMVGFKVMEPLGEGRFGEEQFVYATVINREEGGFGYEEAFQMYKLDIGGREVVVFASNIYQFHREKLTRKGDGDEITIDFEELSQKLGKDITFAYINLPSKERGDWLIRLISQWQPGNNRYREQLCKQVLKFIEHKTAVEETNIAENAGDDDKTETYDISQVVEYTAQRAKENRRHIQQQRKWLASNSKMSKSLEDPVNYDFFRFLSEAEEGVKDTKTVGEDFYNRAYTNFGRRHATYSSHNSFVGNVTYKTAGEDFYNRPYKTFSRGHATHSSRISSLGHEPSPRPQEARQWFRQAEEDLKASKHDVSSSQTAYEWALYKSHKAAEKALQAAYLTKDSDTSPSTNLVTLASRMHDRNLSDMAQEIADITGDGSKLQYPTQGQIPHDKLGIDHYRIVYSLTERLLRWVHDKYLIQARIKRSEKGWWKITTDGGSPKKKSKIKHI